MACTCPPQFDCNKCRASDWLTQQTLETPRTTTPTPVPVHDAAIHTLPGGSAVSEPEPQPEAEAESATSGGALEHGPQSAAVRHNVPYVYKHSKDNVLLNGVLPLHRKGEELYSCGKMNVDTFPYLAAVLYTLQNENKDHRLQIGTLLTDSCSSAERSRRDAFTFLAGEGVPGDPQSPTAPSTSVVGYLAFDALSSASIADVASDAAVNVILPTASVRADSSTGSGEVLHALPNSRTEMKGIAALLKLMSWDMVSVVYTGSDSDVDALQQEANSLDICLVEKIDLEKNDIRFAIEKLQDRKKEGGNAVVVLAEQNLIRDLLESADDVGTEFVWVGDERWGDNPNLVNGLRNAKGALTVKAGTEPIPALDKFIENLTMSHHHPIPDVWFEEFWQEHFKCRLEGSKVELADYTLVCDEDLKLAGKDFHTGNYAYQTVLAVNATLQGFRSYVEHYCPDLHLLGIDVCLRRYANREGLSHFLQNAKVTTGERDFMLTSKDSNTFTYNVYNFKRQKGGSYKYEKVRARSCLKFEFTF